MLPVNAAIAKRRRVGNFLTFLNLGAIVLIFMVLGPAWQKKHNTYTMVQGYRMAINSLSFNNATFVELRTLLQDQPLEAPYQLTFYDGDEAVASYAFMFPTNKEEQVNEYSLPAIKDKTIRAVFVNQLVETEPITLTSPIKTMK